MKDLFSKQSQLYQLARPTYPSGLIEQLLVLVSHRELAWDCGAGSGQLTQMLAPYFDQIVATDISAEQLKHAPYFENVSYQVQAAEQTTFPDHCFDLITVAQAIHWFNFDAFYQEVKRTLKPEGILAVIGYGLIQTSDQLLNDVIHALYSKTLQGFWDAERRYIDEEYRSIPFPFEEVSVPEFTITAEWTYVQLLSYLQTWSAVAHYQEKTGENPVDKLFDLRHPEQLLQVEFPILLRVGHIEEMIKVAI